MPPGTGRLYATGAAFRQTSVVAVGGRAPATALEVVGVDGSSPAAVGGVTPGTPAVAGVTPGTAAVAGVTPGTAAVAGVTPGTAAVDVVTPGNAALAGVTPACAVVGVTRVRAGDGREAELAVVGVTPCTGAVAGGELGVAPAAEVVGVALDEAEPARLSKACS
jgi:hypothetical protein